MQLNDSGKAGGARPVAVARVAVAASQTQIGPIYSLCERKQNRSHGVYSRMFLQGGASGHFVGFSEFSHVAKVAGPKQNGANKIRVPSVTDLTPEVQGVREVQETSFCRCSTAHEGGKEGGREEEKDWRKGRCPNESFSYF